MAYYKITIQYDGTRYCGWQIQENALTVQGMVQSAIGKVLRSHIALIGAGRTDSGVHAIGMAASFQYDGDIDFYRFLYSLNSVLPPDIAVTGGERMAGEFNARYDACRRTYYYLLTTLKSPFYLKYAWHIHAPFTTEGLNEISAGVAGTHDFTSFTKHAAETENRICTVYGSTWRRRGNLFLYRIEGDRFLHGMVRAIVGTTVRTFLLHGSGDDIRKIIEKKDRTAAGESAPAQGLFFYSVRY